MPIPQGIILDFVNPEFICAAKYGWATIVKKKMLIGLLLVAMSLGVGSGALSRDSSNDIMERYRTISLANKNDQLGTKSVVKKAITKCIGEINSPKAEEIAYILFTDTVDVVSLGLSRQETHALLDRKLKETVGTSANGLQKEVFEEVIHFINSMNEDAKSMMCIINETSSKL
jgi:hypothetical protein